MSNSEQPQTRIVPTMRGAPPLLAVALALRPLLTGSLAPFAALHLPQPVPGAARGVSADGWREGKLCDVSLPPFSAKGDNVTDDTLAIQRAIDACGDLPAPGGTVLLRAGRSFVSGSLWLRSNLTFRVAKGATLIGSTRWAAYPMVYTRSSCTMMEAHAALLNGGRCLAMKQPRVGWDDCARWRKLENVVIDGGGEISGNGDQWWQRCTPTCPDGSDTIQRPTLFGLLWVDGLTISGLTIRHSAFWTIHPTSVQQLPRRLPAPPQKEAALLGIRFSNNVRVTGNDVLQTGPGTDGLDPDSCWNVCAAPHAFPTPGVS